MALEGCWSGTNGRSPKGCSGLAVGTAVLHEFHTVVQADLVTGEVVPTKCPETKHIFFGLFFVSVILLVFACFCLFLLDFPVILLEFAWFCLILLDFARFCLMFLCFCLFLFDLA